MKQDRKVIFELMGKLSEVKDCPSMKQIGVCESNVRCCYFCYFLRGCISKFKENKGEITKCPFGKRKSNFGTYLCTGLEKQLRDEMGWR